MTRTLLLYQQLSNGRSVAEEIIARTNPPRPWISRLRIAAAHVWGLLDHIPMGVGSCAMILMFVGGLLSLIATVLPLTGCSGPACVEPHPEIANPFLLAATGFVVIGLLRMFWPTWPMTRAMVQAWRNLEAEITTNRSGGGSRGTGTAHAPTSMSATTPALTHDQACELGQALALKWQGLVGTEAPSADDLVWADLVQFVLFRARAQAAEQEARGS